MRKIIFICCILLGLSVSAQGLYPDQNEKGKWGYIDDNSTVVIKHKYEYATDFVDGWAKVRKGDKWGYIDCNDKEIVKITYSEIRNWEGDYCRVATGGDVDDGILVEGGKWGYINRKGEVVLKCEYEEIGSFVDSIAYVKKGDKYGYINQSMQVIVPCQFAAVGAFNDKGLCWVNKGGKQSKTNASVITGGKYGVYCKDGREIIPAKYTSLGVFKPWVNKRSEEDLEKLKFYTRKIVEESGTHRLLVKNRVENKLFSVLDISESTYLYASKKDDGSKNGVFDLNGNEIIPVGEYYCAFGPEEGMSVVIPKKGKGCNYYNIATKTLLYTNTVYDTYAFEDGVAVQTMYDSAKKAYYSYLINKTGACISSKYPTVRPKKDGVYVVQGENMKNGIIDAFGNEIVSLSYNLIFPPYKGLFAAQEKDGDMFGFIDKYGVYKIHPQYSAIFPYKYDYAFVKKNNGWGIIDVEGNEVIPCQWHTLNLISAENPKYQWAQKSSGSSWTCLDFATGKPIFECQYKGVWNFDAEFENRAFVKDSSDKFGIVDATGDLVLPCAFESYEVAKRAYNFMLKRGRNKWTKTDTYRFKISIDDNRNAAKLTEVIQSTLWDY